MAVLDRSALLAWLRTRATTSSPLVHAIYTGTAERITRGDFDQPTEKTVPASVPPLNRDLDNHLEQRRTS